jgi:hypothetical protein
VQQRTQALILIDQICTAARTPRRQTKGHGQNKLLHTRARARAHAHTHDSHALPTTESRRPMPALPAIKPSALHGRRGYEATISPGCDGDSDSDAFLPHRRGGSAEEPEWTQAAFSLLPLTRLRRLQLRCAFHDHRCGGCRCHPSTGPPLIAFLLLLSDRLRLRILAFCP